MRLLARLTVLSAFVACSSYSSSDPGTTDAGGNDAGGVDGASDGGGETDAAEAGPRPAFCTTRSPAPTYCNDFDDAVSVNDGFTYVLPKPPTPDVTLDTKQALSGTKSLSFHMARQDATTTIGIDLMAAHNKAPVIVASGHLEVAVRIESIDSFAPLWLLMLRPTPNTDSMIVLQATKTTTTLLRIWDVDAGGRQSATTPLQTAIPLATWTQLALDYDRASNHVVVSVGGTPVDVALEPAFAGGGGSELDIGLQYYADGPLAETQVDYDNLLFDVK